MRRWWLGYIMTFASVVFLWLATKADMDTGVLWVIVALIIFESWVLNFLMLDTLAEMDRAEREQERLRKHGEKWRKKHFW